jgi:hypothetical protein
VIVIADIESAGSAVNVHSRNLLLTLHGRYQKDEMWSGIPGEVCQTLLPYHLFYNSAIKMDMSA